MRLVTNATVRALLNPGAVDKVYELPIPASVGWTTSAGGQLVMNRVPLRSSVWPNRGLAYVRKVFDVGAVYCQGRTKGPPPACHVCEGSTKSTPDAPCGANISLNEQPRGDWVRELAAGPGFGHAVTVRGYLNNDWYLATHTIARVVQDRINTSVQFGEYDRYGVCEAIERGSAPCGGGAPGRFTVQGPLSEVDSPGEFFYLN